MPACHAPVAGKLPEVLVRPEPFPPRLRTVSPVVCPEVRSVVILRVNSAASAGAGASPLVAPAHRPAHIHAVHRGDARPSTTGCPCGSRVETLRRRRRRIVAVAAAQSRRRARCAEVSGLPGVAARSDRRDHRPGFQHAVPCSLRSPNASAPFEDLNGDGTPELVIFGYSGGALLPPSTRPGVRRWLAPAVA